MRLNVKNRILLKGLTIFALLFVSFAYCQEPTSHIQFKNYRLYFDQPQEEIFLDLSKNTFFIDERIKFAGYVFDKVNKVPSTSTVNVYCGIYDENGNLISNRLFYTEKGKFHGELKIPAELGSGKYYIKAYTNWMKNFPEEFMFLQEIFVIDENFDKSDQVSQVENSIEIYPEGGHLIANVNNSVGFAVSINQKNNTTYESCFLLDEKEQKVVQNIRISSQGYGKFSLTPKEEKNYRLVIIMENGDRFQQELPIPKKKGLSIVLNPTMEKNISLEINCDQETLASFKNDPIVIAVHRDGVLKLIHYQIKEQNSSVILPKGVVLPGLNKLSIFDVDQNLLAERIFFNDTHIRSLKNIVNTQLVEKALDSVTVALTIDNLKRGATAQLSVSVLPNESKARDYNWSMSSWLLLQSYFNSSMDSELFFKHMSRQKLFDLDLFLLNNKWNRYNWNDIEQPKSVFYHSFDKGISLQGKFSGDEALKNKELVLYQQSIGEFFSTKIDNELSFSMDDLYIIQDEPIFFFTKDYLMTKYTKVNLTYLPGKEENSLSQEEIDRFLKRKQVDLKKSLNPVPVRFPDTELLDEIVLETKKKTELKRNPRLTVGIFEGEKISERDIFKHIRLSSYLRKKGFKIRRHPAANKFILLPKNVLDTHPPIVYIDGVRSSIYIDDFQLHGVDEVYYEHFGVEGSDGGTVYIYRKFGYEKKDNGNKLLQKIAEVGFSTSSSDTKLKFTEFIKNYFVSYGNVYWNGDIELKRNGTYQLKFPSYSLKEFRIYINGFSNKGDIISSSNYISLD